MKIDKSNLHFVSDNKTSKYNILKSYEKILMMVEDILGDKETDNIQLYNLGKHLFGDIFLMYIVLINSQKILKIINVLLLILILKQNQVHIGVLFINIKIIFTSTIHSIDQ